MQQQSTIKDAMLFNGAHKMRATVKGCVFKGICSKKVVQPPCRRQSLIRSWPVARGPWPFAPMSHGSWPLPQCLMARGLWPMALCRNDPWPFATMAHGLWPLVHGPWPFAPMGHGPLPQWPMADGLAPRLGYSRPNFTIRKATRCKNNHGTALTHRAIA